MVSLPAPKYDLSPEAAIEEMKAQLSKMRAETDRNQLKNISSDDAYELGYEAALFDYAQLTGPNPFEVGVIVFTAKDGSDE